MNDVDVLVVGAGPAGSVAAHCAAGLGARVMLVDRGSFPRSKVCGCCVNRRALDVLESCQLHDVVERLKSNPIDAFRLHARSRSVKLDASGGVAVSRTMLDHALIDAARARGVTFRSRTSAQVERDGVVRLSTDGCTESIRAGCVVVADGLGGHSLASHPDFHVAVHPRARMGLGMHLPSSRLPQGEVVMACARAGYVGMVTLETGELDIAAAVDAAFVQSCNSPTEAIINLLHEAGVETPRGINDAKCHGTPLLTRQRTPLAAARTFVVGDAASYVEPFTGEGIAWAMAGGRAVAPLAVEAATNWRPTLALAWQREHARLIKQRQRGCRLVMSALRRPRLVSSAIALMSLFPTGAAPLVRHFAPSQA